MPRKNRFSSKSNNNLLLFGIIAVAVIIYFATKNSGSSKPGGSTGYNPGTGSNPGAGPTTRTIDNSVVGLGINLSVTDAFTNISKSRFGESPSGESPSGDSPSGDSPSGDSPSGDSPSPSPSPYYVKPKSNNKITIYPNGEPISSSLEDYASRIPDEYYPGVPFTNKSYQILFMIMNYELEQMYMSSGVNSTILELYDKIGMDRTEDFGIISNNIRKLSKDEYNILSYALLSNVYMINENLQGMVKYFKSGAGDRALAADFKFIFSAIRYFINVDLWNNIDTVGSGWKNYVLSNSFKKEISFSGETSITPVDLDLSKKVKNIVLVYNGKGSNCYITLKINGKKYSKSVAWFDNPNNFNIQLYIPPLDYKEGLKIDSDFSVTVSCSSSSKAVLSNIILAFVYY
jgi:hypothetical protein